MSPLRTRKWDGSVLLGGTGEEPGWSNPFVAAVGQPGSLIGQVEPVGGVNVGAGIFEGRPFPTATLPIGTTGLPSGVTYNSTNKRYTVAAGTTIENWVIPGFLTLAIGAKAINVWVKGPPAEQTGGALAMVEGPASVGQGTIEWSTVDPAVASAWYDAAGRGVIARYCDFKNVVDGFRAFSTNTSVGARIRGEAVHCHSAVQYTPDYANGNRAETHNDVGCQLQGNQSGDDTDIYFYGCSFDGRHSTTKGDLVDLHRLQISAIMLTPQPGLGPVHGTFTWGWLRGGIFCVNAGSDTLRDGSTFTLTNSRFERPGTDFYGDGRAPDIALAVDSLMTFTHSGNTYIDNGAPVPRSSA